MSFYYREKDDLDEVLRFSIYRKLRAEIENQCGYSPFLDILEDESQKCDSGLHLIETVESNEFK